MAKRKRKKHHFKVRIEAWDRDGNNLGWRMHHIFVDNLNAAIEEARDMYKTLFVHEKKELRIVNEALENVWGYKNW